MSGDNIAQVIYLVLLGSVIGFWFLIQNRQSMNRTLQYAAVWGLIFVGVIAAAGLWGDIRQASLFTQSVDAETGEIDVPRSPDGHYYLTLDINGEPVKFIVDTGATDMVLTLQDAERAGVTLEDASFFGRANTANGQVRVAPVTLDAVTLGEVTDRGVRASVNEGDMDASLLGMSYLQRFDRIEISNGKLVLVR